MNTDQLKLSIFTALAAALILASCKTQQSTNQNTAIRQPAMVEEVKEKESRLVSSFKEVMPILKEPYIDQREDYKKNLEASLDFTVETLEMIAEDMTASGFYFAEEPKDGKNSQVVLKNENGAIAEVYPSGGGLSISMGFAVELDSAQIKEIENVYSTVEDINAGAVFLQKRNAKESDKEYTYMGISFLGVPVTPDRYEEGEYEPIIRKQVIPAFKTALANLADVDFQFGE